MDVTQVALVMSFGALVAAAGLALLFFRREQAENRIKIFGQEFQISTPALVVFLVGCSIFILPPIIQMQDHTVFSTHIGQSEDRHINHEISPTDGNHQIPTAKLVAIGTTIKGVIATAGQRDFFKFKGSKSLKTRVILRKTAPGGFSAEVTIYDNVESKVASEYAYGEDSVSLVFQSNPNSDYYAKIGGHTDTAVGPYELLLKEE
jgi:hypothetical protein